MNESSPTGPNRRGVRDVLELQAAGAGAVTAFLTSAFGLVLALGARAVFDWSKGGATAVASAFVLFGCVLGGFRAGLGAPRAPLSNGAAAGAVAGVTISLAQRLIAQKGLNPLGLVFVALLCGSLGVFGGYVANNANRTRALRSER